MFERQVTRDAGHPLHDVEATEPCREHEVASFSQIVRPQWVEREFGRVEVAPAEVVGIDDAQHLRRAVEIPVVGGRDDVDGPGCAGKPCAPTASPPISTYSTAPSESAAISSSGANIRLAAQVRLQLSGDTAESDGLLETLGHRALEVAPAVLGSCRLVATDPRLDRMIVRHRE
jgi:hypothetical protein